MPLLLPLLPLLGCAADPPAPDDGSDSDVPSVPYIYEPEDDGASPLLTVDDVAVALDAALSAAWSVDARPVLAAYHLGMADADASCPNYYDYDGSQYWYDACDASSGARFDGYAFNVVYDDYDVGDGALYNGEALYGVGEVTSADGETIGFGGQAYWLEASPAGLGPDDPSWYLATQNIVQGGFSYSGATDGWLADGEAPDLAAYVYWVPSYDGRFVYVDGAVTVDDATAPTVVYDELMLYSANLVPDCPNEPYGGMAVRDSAGDWYDVVFDGPPDTETMVDAARCDGCGDVYVRGELLGSACADFARLLTWESSPWE